jgi:hypothetical protein
VASLPRISVVVPSLDQGRFLRQALASLVDQRYPALEVVVMDGGSQDESPAVIREHAPHLAYWRSQADGGQAAAINEGVRHCTGELVTWLNADDFHWQDALWVVARAFRRNPGRGLYVGNGFRHVEATGRRRRFCPGHLAFHREALSEGLDYVLQPATFILREAWDAVGGLDERLRYGLDWDLFRRIARDRAVVTVNEFLAASREHAETKTSLGGLRRAAELVQIVQDRTERRITPGTAYYVLDALRAAAAADLPPAVVADLDRALHTLQASMRGRWGGEGVFPEAGDPQDTVDVPLAGRPELDGEPARAGAPRLSVIVVAPGGAAGPALESVLAQGIPDADVLVVHRGDAFPPPGFRAVPVPGDWSLARALEEGLRAATGDVVTWLDGEDRLAALALARMAALFAGDPALDAATGHALYVDAGQRAAYVASGGRRIGVRLAGVRPEPSACWPSRRSRLFLRREALARARAAAGEGFWPALSGILDDGRTAVAERTLWLYPVDGPAEADEPVAVAEAADEGPRPRILQRWVAALPRHGAMRRLGRAVVRRVRGSAGR